MFRPASRLIARPSALRALPRALPTKRFLSTAPPTQKSRSWKSLVARVGIAGAIIYYYNTTDVFAEEPRHLVQPLPETDHETEQYQTIDAISKERQQRRAELAAAEKASKESAQETATPGGVEGLEEEADQQGAFNPETGEINWDCPCLGGMANGPCGEEFKAAFSCFVYSTEEEKGRDCVDKFLAMQTCFRQYPEIYGTELDTDEDDDVTAEPGQPLTADAASKPTPSEPSADAGAVPAARNELSEPASDAPTEGAKAATEQVRKEHPPLNESDDVIPKVWHDERAANEKALTEEKNKE